MERNCLYCDKPIRFGRADKKFCDSGCKDEYYNSIRNLEQREIGRIDRILKRNRRVLKKLYQSNGGDGLFKWEDLVRGGFDFDFHTHVDDTVQRIVYCYDYGYRGEADGFYRLYKFSQG